jgi:hypothetical protein
MTMRSIDHDVGVSLFSTHHVICVPKYLDKMQYISELAELYKLQVCYMDTKMHTINVQLNVGVGERVVK